MFKKLLSNLPFNPSLIGQLTFYANRLHREAFIRRTGFVMLIMAMIIQMFAVVSPPQASLQASPNTDLINGGFSNKSEAVKHCQRNTQDFKTIMEHFGITCAAISDAQVTTIKPKDHNSKLWSMGRQAFGVKDETPVRVPGAGTFFVRHFWSLNHDPSYKALKVKDSRGQVHYILFGCGNLVSIGIPTPPPPPPKDVCDNKPGIQTDVRDCDECPDMAGIQRDKSKCDVCPNRPGVQTKKSDCDVCPDRPGTQATKDKCDVCPNKPGVQGTSKECDVCPNRTGIQVSTDECDTCPDTPGVQGSNDSCDVCPNIAGTQTSKDQCIVPDPPKTPITPTTPTPTTPTTPNPPITPTDPKSCAAAQSNNDLTACLEYKKTARNTTQNIADANNTTAQAGDVIVYTLTTKNIGKKDIKGYQVNESLGDVLDYADVIDLHGGTKGDYEMVTWPKEDIKAGATLTHTITVKIKSVIPQTPASATDPNHFDMVMTNVYGNTVNIKLPPSVGKQIEIATTTLPNTGPGTSLVIGFTLVTIAGYFLARSNLLAKELDIVRADFGAAGGY